MPDEQLGQHRTPDPNVSVVSDRHDSLRAGEVGDWHGNRTLSLAPASDPSL
jgi:hypothetical protein